MINTRGKHGKLGRLLINFAMIQISFKIASPLSVLEVILFISEILCLKNICICFFGINYCEIKLNFLNF